ncbi:MAG TPA: DUF111 family protein [Euryarchaeota archaeon]|nr:DUF111 family protein [Euryarchaeota archaeon]
MNIYLDMTAGVDSDALASACYSFLGEAERKPFAEALDRACGLFAGRADFVEVVDRGKVGFRIEWKLRGHERKCGFADGKETMRKIADSLELSSYARKMTNDAIDELAEAAGDPASVDFPDLGGHGVTMTGLLMDFAAVGKFADLIGLSGNRPSGSFISIGENYADGDNGEKRVPSPVAARLLVNMRFRFGPSFGDFAGPPGLAIIRQLLHAQTDTVPETGREGLGFGRRIYGGKRLSVRLMEQPEGE